MAELNKVLEGRLLAYRPLDQARREIRLVELRVELQAASNGKQVPLLRMHQAFLDAKDLPRYTALSYTWGTVHDSIVLIEDEKRPAREVLVSVNLADALCHFVGLLHAKRGGLKRFFNPRKKRLYWIDQLCINQNDDDEKSHQVKMMMDIFGRAKATHAWLGSEEATVSHGWMRKFTQKYYDIKAAIADDDIRGRDLRSDDPTIFSQWIDRILRECREDNYKELIALAAFCRHPWFGRAWVVQEIATSGRSILFHWERGYCQYSEFIGLYMLLMWLFVRVEAAKNLYPIFVQLRSRQAIEMLTMTATLSIDQPRTKPLTWIIAKMLNSGQMRATKPEDLVYSMMGISSDGGTCGIEVDYAKHYTEVFRETALLFLKTRGARTLAWSGQLDRKSDADDCRLPSWVPDLRLPAARPIHRDIRSADLLLAPKLFSAAGNCRFEFTADSKSEILSIRTSYADRVVGMSKPFGFLLQSLSALTPQNILAAWDLLPQSQAMLEDFRTFVETAAERHPTRYDYTTRQEMHWRMPIADCYFDGDHLKRAGLEAKALYMATLHPDECSSGAVISPSSINWESNYLIEHVAFVTETGYLGIGHPEIVMGDEVHLIQGSDTPFVLRKTDGHYELIGETYVHGIMDGELVDDDTEFEWVQIH